MVEKRQGKLLTFTKTIEKNKFFQLQKKKCKDSLSFTKFTPKCPQKHNHCKSSIINNMNICSYKVTGSKKFHTCKLNYIRIKRLASALEVQLDKKFHNRTKRSFPQSQSTPPEVTICHLRNIYLKGLFVSLKLAQHSK